MPRLGTPRFQMRCVLQLVLDSIFFLFAGILIFIVLPLFLFHLKINFKLYISDHPIISQGQSINTSLEERSFFFDPLQRC